MLSILFFSLIGLSSLFLLVIAYAGIKFYGIVNSEKEEVSKDEIKLKVFVLASFLMTVAGIIGLCLK